MHFDNMPAKRNLDISVSLVEKLIAEQFSQWVDLQIEPVAFGGVDNRTFHLGENMSVRLPSAEGYSPQVEKEHRWLPKLAPLLYPALRRQPIYEKELEIAGKKLIEVAYG